MIIINKRIKLNINEFGIKSRLLMQQCSMLSCKQSFKKY